MIRPDQGKYPITQLFGENPQIYSRFGMLGHNGWDLDCPTGTTLISPHSGKVTEIGDDSDGYGIYLKIESDFEGSVLAHNKQILVLKGQYVDEGQAVTLSNNTGFSTGPHSHWGYFRKPRDRTNGYAGYIDPTPYLSSIIGPVMDDQTIIDLGQYGKHEIQAIKGFYGDALNWQKDLENTRQALKECQSKSPEGSNSADLDQVNIQQLLIALIKKIFK